MPSDESAYQGPVPDTRARERFSAPIHGRELGRRLRAALQAAGFTGVTLAAALTMSETRVSRIMNGLIAPSVADAAAMLTVCGVFGEERDQLLDLCHPRHDDNVLRISDGTQWEAFVYHAGQATRLIEYQPLMIPWLAQNEDYATAYWGATLLRPGPKPWTPKLDQRPAMTLRAQLDRIEFLVHEWALRAPVTSHAARAVQMQDVVALSFMRSVSLRVIPATRVLPVTALSGFTVLEYSDRPTLVYREEPASGVFFDDPVQVAAHQEIVAQVRQIAVSVPRSRELMEQIRDESAPQIHPVDLFPG